MTLTNFSDFDLVFIHTKDKNAVFAFTWRILLVQEYGNMAQAGFEPATLGL